MSKKNPQAAQSEGNYHLQEVLGGRCRVSLLFFTLQLFLVPAPAPVEDWEQTSDSGSGRSPGGTRRWKLDSDTHL